MGRRNETSAVVDEMIRFVALGGVLATVVIAPNAVQVLEKPLKSLDKKLDERARSREAKRVIRYMKQEGLLAGDYEHGLQLTNKARNRLEKIELRELSIRSVPQWDKIWRMVVYDIPESHRYARRFFASELRRLGCFQLQKSTWISPFVCRQEVSTIASQLDIDSYTSYFEVINLDNSAPLIKRFAKKYPETKF